MLSCAEPHPLPTTYHQPTYADLCRPVPTRADLCRPVPTCALPTRAFRESAECPSTNTDPPPPADLCRTDVSRPGILGLGCRKSLFANPSLATRTRSM